MANFNKDELILDRVRSMSVNELDTNKMLFRLTSLEEPTLGCTAEGEEVTDAVGSVITTLYRAKKATFGATNSLISLGLAAAQYGTKKEVATLGNAISVPTYEIVEVADGKITLANKPNADIKYIYAIEKDGVGTTYESGEAAGTDKFVHVSGSKEITVGTEIKGKIYVEYTYDSENAVKVKNSASAYPEAVSLVIYAYFKDKCNENKVYSGIIICPKAKLDPSQVELALTSTGKHPFTFQMMKDYCDEVNDELFTIIVSE